MQTQAIHRSLKEIIRSKGKTYADAAGVLNLSEASVKRLFSSAGLSIQRLETLCNWLGIDIKEVILDAERHQPFITQLTLEQEKELTDNPRLLLVTYLVLNNWKEREIKEEFDYTDAELNKHFIKLEKIGFIVLFPFNRIRLLTARNFKWSEHGPVRKFFKEKILPDFIKTDFTHPDEKMYFLGGMLSEGSIMKVHEKLDEFSQYFDQLIQNDLTLPVNKRHGVNMMLGFRRFMFAKILGVTRKTHNRHL